MPGQLSGETPANTIGYASHHVKPSLPFVESRPGPPCLPQVDTRSQPGLLRRSQDLPWLFRDDSREPFPFSKSDQNITKGMHQKVCCVNLS